MLLVVTLWGAWVVREYPDPARAPALEMVDRLDATFRAVRADELELDTTPSEAGDGIVGARFPRVRLEDRWVLTGASGASCYVLWWDEDGARRTRTLPRGDPCVPSTEAMSPRPGTWDRIGDRVVTDPAEPSAWDGVVPDPVRLRWWYLPWTILGGGLLVAALVRISIALLTGAPPAMTRR